MNFRDALVLIDRVTTLPLREAIALADALSTGLPDNLDDHSSVVRFARMTPEVMNYLPDRKIAAIKELRSQASVQYGMTLGLLEAKNAVDAVVCFTGSSLY